jgi:hypothetical protein
VKDQLEDHLHELVCQGKVQLTTAQNEIATDWISAYKRYFNTDKPQPHPTTVAATDAKDEIQAGGWHNRGSGRLFIADMARWASTWHVPATIVAPRLIE